MSTTERRFRHNLAKVRETLDILATGLSNSEAGRRVGINDQTVARWARYAATQPAGWPTPADIAAWEEDERTNGPRRRYNAGRKRIYEKRVYLARGGLLIPALGTTRRMQALAALGWTTTDMAPRLGVGTVRAGHLLSGVYDRVHRDTAARVAKLYDELSMTVPRDGSKAPRAGRVHERQRRDSAKKGWAPPLAWDDIDDPDEEPQGATLVPAKQPRAEVLAEVDEEGGNIHDACRRLKISQKAIERWCQRRDMGELYSRLAWRANPKRIAVDGERVA